MSTALPNPRAVSGGAAVAPSPWLPLGEAESTQRSLATAPQGFSEGPLRPLSPCVAPCFL